ncbi:MAG: DUF421 domain-containing protein [Oscillospiraceae bacterium]|nr:DUF421 domain-containing protein [Oscillospiraceae bacterium]MDD3832918.1 DUF421 domain-containing protein [Oscillospiraceae bacterium]MDD4546475.1 DUF421 domain-containing protein [Oscillospiraceae bacterium]
MDILKIALTSIGSFIALFIITKIIGKHQMSQLSMFDYINGITIGSIAAEMATSLDGYIKPFIAMVIYAIMSVLFAFITRKSTALRRMLMGEALVLYDNGKLFRKNFSRAKMDISEFLIQCRNNGYFNLANIQTALLEPNGKISFLPISEHRPMTPQDMNISPEQEKITVNVVLDGKIIYEGLKQTDNNEAWLLKQLEIQGIQLKDVFLATCDSKNNISVYVRLDKKVTYTPY